MLYISHHIGTPQIRSGVKDMKVMKTTKSSFVNFVRDEFRSLPDAPDRVFITVVDCQWDYGAGTCLDYDKTW